MDILNYFHKYYLDRGVSIKRLRLNRWLSLSNMLTDEKCSQADEGVFLRLATEDDIRWIAAHPYAKKSILGSVLRFWQDYNIRTLYLGYFNDEDEPTILQYVLDHRMNHVYDTMRYGKMYLPQTATSVQLENLFRFPDKRKRMASTRFAKTLFNRLWKQGIWSVRTHIHAVNKPALVWASNLGFRPVCWISMLTFELPLLRKTKPSFIFEPFKKHEWGENPLMMFGTHTQKNTVVAIKPEYM